MRQITLMIGIFCSKQEEKILNEPAAIYWFNEILLVILSGHQNGLSESLLMTHQWFTTSNGLKLSFFELRHPKKKNNYWPALALQVKCTCE